MSADDSPLSTGLAERSFPADAKEWFELVEVEPGVHLVAEPGHVFSWLIHGSERSVLLDTGLGIADIAAAIATVAPDASVTVVNSHTHFDHIGGNELFDEVLMHDAGPGLLEHNTQDAELEAYDRLVGEVEPLFRSFLELDRQGPFVLSPDQYVRPWPQAAIASSGWHMHAPQPTGLLADGDEIDLGDRTLRVIHTPGHCPDHICLHDETAGILFAQDQAYYGPQLIYLPESDVGDYARSARRLADEMSGSVRTVYCAHSLRPTVWPHFLNELAEAAEEVAAGEAELVAMSGLFGEDVVGTDRGDFQILVSKDFQGGGRE